MHLPVQSILGSMIEGTGFFIHRRRDFENTENQPDITDLTILSGGLVMKLLRPMLLP
jgi:hypothetical protein